MFVFVNISPIFSLDSQLDKAGKCPGSREVRIFISDRNVNLHIWKSNINTDRYIQVLEQHMLQSRIMLKVKYILFTSRLTVSFVQTIFYTSYAVPLLTTKGYIVFKCDQRCVGPPEQPLMGWYLGGEQPHHSKSGFIFSFIFMCNNQK